MSDEKKQTFKTVLLCLAFAAGGFVLAAILNGSVTGGLGGLILGVLGLAHRSGVRRATDIADDIGDRIDRADENNRAIESGINRASERVDESEKLVDVAERHNRNALAATRRAKDILERARDRSRTDR